MLAGKKRDIRRAKREMRKDQKQLYRGHIKATREAIKTGYGAPARPANEAGAAYAVPRRLRQKVRRLERRAAAAYSPPRATGELTRDGDPAPSSGNDGASNGNGNGNGNGGGAGGNGGGGGYTPDYADEQIFAETPFTPSYSSLTPEVPAGALPAEGVAPDQGSGGVPMWVWGAAAAVAGLALLMKRKRKR